MNQCLQQLWKSQPSILVQLSRGDKFWRFRLGQRHLNDISDTNMHVNQKILQEYHTTDGHSDVGTREEGNAN